MLELDRYIHQGSTDRLLPTRYMHTKFDGRRIFSKETFNSSNVVNWLKKGGVMGHHASYLYVSIMHVNLLWTKFLLSSSIQKSKLCFHQEKEAFPRPSFPTSFTPSFLLYRLILLSYLFCPTQWNSTHNWRVGFLCVYTFLASSQKENFQRQPRLRHHRSISRSSCLLCFFNLES